jgi:hypothetical protein
LTRDARFCFACGQSLKEFSRPWLEFVRDSLAELTDFDGRMMQSMRLLLTRPGLLSREYIDGRRVAHTPPIRMYLIVSLAFFFVLPLILPDSSVSNPDHDFSVDLYSRGMFILLPIFALLLKIFYRRYFYIDHLVFTVHLFSAMFIVFAVLLATETLADRYTLVMLGQVVVTVYMVAYLIIALHTNYSEGWLKSTFKFLGLMLTFLPILAWTIELASHSNQ